MENHSQNRTEGELREQAEAMLAVRAVEALHAADDSDPLRLLHELQVHKVELELQNQELRETRNELESALSRYLDFYDLSPVAFLTLQQGSLIREANLRAYDLLDAERPTLLGQLLRDFIAPDDRAQFNACLTQVLSELGSRVFEGDVVTERRTLRVRMELFSVDTGDLCRVVALDVTAARQGEQSLANERILLRQVIDTCPSLVFVKDATGRLVLGNTGVAAYLGVPAEELPGHLAPEFPSSVRSATAVEAALQSGEACMQCVLAPDGSTRFFVTRETPLADAQGGSSDSTLVVATEVTELRHAEAALREAEQVKNGLLAMLGYDMREYAGERRHVHPVPAQGAVLPGGDRYQLLAEQLRQLTHTVDALIGESASPQNGHVATGADLDAAIKEAEKIAAVVARDKGQTLDVVLPRDRIRLPGDLAGLTQLFLTLLGNAVSAAPAGGVIGLRASVMAREDGVDVEIRIRIGEACAGIDPQPAAGAAPDPNLPLVRALVAEHGGTFAATDAGDYVVRLPVLADEQTQDLR